MNTMGVLGMVTLLLVACSSGAKVIQYTTDSVIPDNIHFIKQILHVDDTPKTPVVQGAEIIRVPTIPVRCPNEKKADSRGKCRTVWD